MSLRNNKRQIQNLITLYESRKRELEGFAQGLVHGLTYSELGKFIHFIKWRPKNPKRLAEKIEDKLNKASLGQGHEINESNLFCMINDLVGIRIIHLHSSQLEAMHPLLLAFFEENRYILKEPPFGRTWDDESKNDLKGLGIEAQDSLSMYTSVHYVVYNNTSKDLTAEIQVRTLAEELWGEVDHKLNYPTPSESRVCKQQLKVLARATSTCSRLVDTIFLTHEEHCEAKGRSRRRRGS